MKEEIKITENIYLIIEGKNNIRITTNGKNAVYSLVYSLFFLKYHEYKKMVEIRGYVPLDYSVKEAFNFIKSLNEDNSLFEEYLHRKLLDNNVDN